MSVNEDISRFAGTYGDVNTGTDSFSYTVDDGVVDSNLTTVSITVTAVFALQPATSAKKLLARTIRATEVSSKKRMIFCPEQLDSMVIRQ